MKSARRASGLKRSLPRPVSAARSLGEAESELEKQARSGYVTVVAFERIGEAERARYGLDRLRPKILDGPAPVSPGVLFAASAIRCV